MMRGGCAVDGSVKAADLDFTQIANKIRVLAIDCEDRDTLSCAFGNAFSPKVEAYLREIFSEAK